jgi:hypothetical protein
MQPQTLFVLVVVASLANGLTSPALGLVFALWPIWLPEIVHPAPEIIFYGASLIVATATLLAAALPAAVAERTLSLSPRPVMVIWALAAVLIAVFAFR